MFRTMRMPTNASSFRVCGFFGRRDVARLTDRNDPGGHIPSPVRATRTKALQWTKRELMMPQASSGAERCHRLHAGRPARRQIAGKQRDDREDARQ